MTLKNNNLQKFEKAADRRQHFGIRKLTVGAASVLLGTTLWLGKDANVVRADTTNSNSTDGDVNASESTNVETPKIDANTQVQVNANNSEVKNVVADSAENNVDKHVVSTDNQTKEVKKVVTGNEKASVPTVDQNNLTSANKDQKVENKKQTSATPTAQETLQAQAEKIQNKVQGSSIADAAAKTATTAQQKLSEVGTQGETSHFNVNKLNLTKGSLKAQYSTDKNVSANNVLSRDAMRIQAAKGNTADEKIDDPKNNATAKTAAARRLAALYGMQLFTTGPKTNTLDLTKTTKGVIPEKQLGSSLINWNNIGKDFTGALANAAVDALRAEENEKLAKQANPDANGNFTATSWTQFRGALVNKNIKQVNFSGDMHADASADVNHDIIVNGAKGSSINFGTNTLNLSNGGTKLTLANLTINSENAGGAIVSNDDDNEITFKDVTNKKNSLFNGKGNVHIQGTVNTSVASDSSTGDLDLQGFANAASTASGAGAGGAANPGVNAVYTLWDTNAAITHGQVYKDRKVPNIYASNLDIDANATLNIKRTAAGDGIVLRDGAITDGKNQITQKTNNGKLHVGQNSTLNVDLNNSNMNGEQIKNAKWDINTTNAAVRVNTNGTLTSDANAHINLRVGSGRGIVFGSRSDSKNTNNNANYISRGDPGMSGLDDRGNTVMIDWINRNPAIQSSVIFGENNTVTLVGRDAFMLGNRATFSSGKGSTVNVHTYGLGNALDMGQLSKIQIDPSSTVEFFSDGKTGPGNYNQNNYIALGGGGDIEVLKDATLRVILTNRGGADLNDDINIASYDPSLSPRIYVGNNATLDVQSDATQGNAELIAVPLPASKSVDFILDNVKYLNLQRTAKNGNTILAPGMKSEMVTALARKGKGSTGSYGNLIFLNAGKGENAHFTAYGDLAAFKWNNANLSSNPVQYDPNKTVSQNFGTFESVADQTWKNMYGFNIPYAGFTKAAANKDGVWVDPSGTTNGTNVNSEKGVSFSDVVNGFSPYMSQRLVVIGHSIQPVENQRTVHYVVQDVDEDGNVLETDPTQMREIAHAYVQDAQGNNAKEQLLYKDNATDQLVAVERNPDGTPKLDEHGAVIPLRDAEGNYQTDGKNINWKSTDTENDGGRSHFKAYTAPKTVTGTDGNNKVVQSLDGGVYKLATDSELATITSNSDEVVRGGKVENSKDFANTSDEFKNGQFYNTYRDGNLYVVYRAIPEKADLKIYDDSTQTNLKTINEGGNDGADIKFADGAKTVQDYLDNGYEFVNVHDDNNDVDLTTKDYGDANFGKYDKDPTVDQSFTVHLRHKIVPITPTTPSTDVPNGTPESAQPSKLSQDVHLTVIYKNNDGTDFKGTVPSNAKQTLTFTGTAYIDATDGKLVNAKKDKDGHYVVDYDNQNDPAVVWTPESQNFAAVDSPAEAGYHVSDVSSNADATGKNVAAITGIKKDSNDVKVIVYYDPDKAPEKDQAKLVYVDDDANGSTIHDASTAQGDKDSQITFNGSSDIVKELQKQGYVYQTVTGKGVTPNSNGFDSVDYPKFDGDKGTQTFTVHFKHDVTPVDPDHPNDKVDPSQYTKKHTQTINYVVDGNDANKPAAPQSNTQTSNWQKTLTLDKVTGEIVPGGKYDKDWSLSDKDPNYSAVKTPVIQGYHANVAEVPANQKTDRDTVVTVHYAPNGHVIPVDKKGNPITGADQPQFPTDPNDATKPVKQIIPTVPDGWTPIDPDKNPGQPINPDKDKGKDVTVPFTKRGKFIVNYVDKDENNKQLHQDPVGGDIGDKNTYQTTQEIGTLTQQGYVLVSDGYNAGPTFTDDNNGQTYTVVFRHRVQEITPNTPPTNVPKGTPDAAQPDKLNKNVELTVDYVNNDGKKFTATVPSNAHQTINFTGTAYVDATNGKLVNATSQNGELVVDNTNTAKPEISWKPNTEQQFSPVISPVEAGYHLIGIDSHQDGNNVGIISGITKDSKSIHVTVTYEPNGHIIPIDQDGHKIPNAPQPQYPTNPNDPSSVVPDEPTPIIDGMKTNTPSVTPQRPYKKDTPVIYVKEKQDQQRAVIQYIDKDNGNSILDQDYVTGDSNSTINYNTTNKINSFENKGYKLDTDEFTDSKDKKFDNDVTKDQTFKVYLIHDVQPVNPDTPGKPGEPINPKDPEGPKYPQGSDQVTKDVTRTVHYVGAPGLPQDIKQTAHFTGSGELDKVTGQWKTPITWTGSGDLKGADSPFVENYHVTRVDRDSNDNINVDKTTVNQNTADYTVTVHYAPNGRIIPVDQSGNPIPTAPNPQYPTDPGNIGQAKPNEPTPVIPGYHTNTPTVTPVNPGVDTPVVYVPDTQDQQTGVIKYQDQDAGNTVIHSDVVYGNSSAPVGYSTAKELSELEKQGYELVNDGYPTDATFDNDVNTPQEWTVVVKHGHQPVNPKNPGKPKQPINPGYPEGPKYPQDSDKVTKDVIRTIHYVGAGDKTPKDVEQKAHFEGDGVLDKVTGAWVKPITWSDAQTLNGVPTTAVDGYHVVRVDRDSNDNVNVDSTTVDHNKDSYQVTVTYALNGKLVPVDPSGNPIPGADQPQYPTDPKNPSGVTPNEPIPDVPGYKPQNPNPVTPQDPGKDTPVIYNKLQNAQVVYRDLDDNNKTLDTDKGFSGVAGDPIKDDKAAGKITNFENQGYVLAKNDLDTNPVFDKIDDNTQTYYIDFHHGKQPIGPKTPGKPGEPINPNDPEGPKYPQDSDKVTKDVIRHIVYKGAGDKTPKQVDQKVSFTGTGTLDKVTGKWILPDGTQTDDMSKALTWSDDKDVPAVPTKFINGYHVIGADKDSTDGINVDGKTLTHNDSDDTVTVTYESNGKIIPVDPSGNPIPNAPTPQYPSDPDNPKGVTPNEGVPDIPGYTPEVPTVTPQDPGKDTKVTYKPVTNPEAKDQVAQVIFRDVDPNATKEQLATSGDIKGKSGSLVSYDPQTEIDTLIKQDYVLKNNGFPQGTVFDNDDKTTQKFFIDFVHGTTTVTPNKPGKPGEPIDPKNPEGPKYPNGTDENAVKRTATQTVHYVFADGTKAADDKTQNFEFTKNITFDNVTGKIIDNGTWNETEHTFGSEDTPVVDGYHANKRTAGGQKVTPDDLKKEVTVTYTPNGHIIPVDPKGNPIPGADHPTFPTDPSDPTKPNTGVVPSVPNGWTPDDKKPGDKINPNPGDPTKDVTVPFHKTETPTPTTEKGSITVKVYDRTDKKTLDEYGKSDSNKDVGTAFSYDKDKVITELTNKGYDVINPEITIPTEITKGDHDYTIYVEHTTTTVTPDKPGKPGEPVDPKNPEGPKYPNGTDENAVKRTATQTVKYTGAGDKTPHDKTQKFDFTRTIVFDNVTGKIKSTTPWNVTEHTFGNEDTPVVDGYHADKRTAGGQKVTPDDLEKTVTVTYTPNGHIIPVDPQHNPIPNVPTPEYPTDPKDPTKVVPDEKVPDITGRIPSQPTVTPQDPGKDTEVVYTTPGKDDVTGKVSYIDDTTKETLKTDPLNGKIGEKITYTTAGTIADYENKGYKLSSNNFRDGKESFAKDGNEFEVHLVHDTTTVTPNNPGKPGEPINPNDPEGPKWPNDTDADSLKKPGKQTIHYVGAGDKTPQDNVQTTEFDHEVVIDKVTGKVTKDNGWTPENHEFGKVDTPLVNGYHADKKTAGGKTVTVDNPETTDTVTYTPNGHIIPVDPNGNPIPNVPTPQYPTDPSDPTKVTSNEPVPTVPGKTPEIPVVTPQDPGKDTKVIYTTPNKDNGEVNVYVHDNTTGRNISEYTYNSGTETVGTKVSFDKNKTITELTNKGYKVENPNVDIPSEITKGTQNVTIYVVHDTTPVNPSNPGKPGEPINPNDPEGPKWPNGTDKNSLNKDVTRTINFVDKDGKPVRQPVTQTVHFIGSGVIDKVTGDYTTPITWSPDQQVGGMDTPFVPGYHVITIDRDNDGVKGVKDVTLTHNNDSYAVNVTYEPNGKIIPVDPNGNPIPNVPTPQYPTDPTDPSGVTPDENVPEIPGYTPSTPTVTPNRPGENTTVVYKPVENRQKAVIQYIDKDNDNAIIHQDTREGDAGSAINYSTAEEINALTDQGYELVTDGFVPGTKFDNDKSADQTYKVILQHAHTTVDPKNPGKPGEPINPNDPEGPKWPNETGENGLTKDSTQTITIHYADGSQPDKKVTKTDKGTFTRKVTVDKVTGQVISKTPWIGSHTFGTEDVPVVEGYHTDKKTIGGKTATPETPNVTDEVTYTPNGKIVPVDPNGNPIPNVPTPQYKTDPKDPTKVVPDEDVPEVPGNTPSQTTVTPNDPSKDTTVVYNNQGGLTIVVHDKTTDTDLTNYGYNSGKVNGDTKVTWNHDEVVKNLKDHGYKIVTDITVPSTVGGKTQTLTMVVEHETTPVGPKNPHKPGEPINPNDPNGPKWPAEDNYTKSYTSTVHFVDENGNPVGKDDVQTSTWNRTLIVDKVTGEVINPNETWTSDKDNYDETKVPVVDGYVVDTKSKNGENVGKTIAGQKVVQDNIEDSVVYHKIGKIVPVDPSGNPIPGADTPIYVNDPDDPSKVVPNENVPDVPGYTPVQNTVTPQDPSKDTEVVYTKNTTPVVPDTPDTSEPTPAPTTPQPTNAPSAPQPTKPAQPSQASEASQPTTPQEPDIPDVPDDKPAKHHHKTTPKHNTPTPVGPSKSNNNTPRPTSNTPAPTPTPYNNSVTPHSQNGYNNSVAPHAQSENYSSVAPHAGKVGSAVAPDGQVLPAGDTVGPKGTIVNSQGKVVGYIDKQGHPHFTLPQTGENNSENTAAVVAGSLAMGLGMIGLAGVKRRKRS